MADDRLTTLAESLGIEPVPENEEMLRRGIRVELRDLHPDRNGGEFPSVESRERFNQLSAALAELDTDTAATSLVPIHQVAPMVTAIFQALGEIGGRGGRTLADEWEAIRTEARQEAHARFRLSRYASAAFASAATGFWVLPGLVAAWGNEGVSAALQASILSPVFAHPLSEAISFGLALYAWMFFGLTWFMEQNDLARIDWVTTDSARRSLLEKAVRAARVRGDSDTIMRADLREAVDRVYRPGFVLRLLGARDLTPSFLDRVVGQHVAELEARQVLDPVEGASISPRYAVADEVLVEIKG